MRQNHGSFRVKFPFLDLDLVLRQNLLVVFESSTNLKKRGTSFKPQPEKSVECISIIESKSFQINLLNNKINDI